MSDRKRQAADNGTGGDRASNTLSDRLRYTFKRPELLSEALTHPSAAGRAGHGGPNYERLEFLGDRVLGLVAADMLLRRFPREAEGPLAQRLAELVRRETLATVAGQLDLGAALHLAKGEDAAGERRNPAILSDACEALIGALYLDGGLAVARGLVEAWLTPFLEQAVSPPRDAKTALQEWAQGRGLPLPEYRETARSGPDHQPLFTIEVTVRDHGGETGQGRSKRLAEQAAAESLMARLRAAG